MGTAQSVAKQLLTKEPVARMSDGNGLNALLARTVRRLRQEKGLSQEDLATLAQVDRTYISGIERARRNITISTLERLIPHLSSNPSEFFTVLCHEITKGNPFAATAALDMGTGNIARAIQPSL